MLWSESCFPPWLCVSGGRWDLLAPRCCSGSDPGLRHKDPGCSESCSVSKQIRKQIPRRTSIQHLRYELHPPRCVIFGRMRQTGSGGAQSQCCSWSGSLSDIPESLPYWQRQNDQRLGPFASCLTGSTDRAWRETQTWPESKPTRLYVLNTDDPGQQILKWPLWGLMVVLRLGSYGALNFSYPQTFVLKDQGMVFKKAFLSHCQNRPLLT